MLEMNIASSRLIFARIMPTRLPTITSMINTAKPTLGRRYVRFSRFMSFLSRLYVVFMGQASISFLNAGRLRRIMSLLTQ